VLVYASVMRARMWFVGRKCAARARAGGGGVAEIYAVHENAPPLPPPRLYNVAPAREPRIRSGTMQCVSARLVVSSHICHAESRCLFSLKAKRNAQRECSACVPGSTSVWASWYVCRSADPRHRAWCGGRIWERGQV
jgi:hypothetical protein